MDIQYLLYSWHYIFIGGASMKEKGLEMLLSGGEMILKVLETEINILQLWFQGLSKRERALNSLAN